MKKPLVFLVAVCLTALGAQDLFANGSKEKVSGPVTLNAIAWISFPSELTVYQTLAADFSKSHPNVTVNFQGYTQNYDEKVTSLYAAGDSPDMLLVNATGSAEQIVNGELAPLDKYISGQDGINLKDLYPSAVEAFTYKGKIYGYAPDVGDQILYYNKKLFDAGGVPYPTANWTWADLANAAQKLTMKDSTGRVSQIGFQYDELNRFFTTVLLSNGGDLFDNDNTPTKVEFNSPIGVAAAEYVKNVEHNLGGAPNPGAPGALSFRDAFRTGKVAITMDGSWMIKAYTEQTDLSYGTQMTPLGSEGRVAWHDDVAWCMSTQTKNPDLAWQLIKAYSSEKVAISRSDYGGNDLEAMPAWITAYSDPNWKPTSLTQPAADQIKYAKAEIHFWGSGKFYWNMLLPAMQQIVATDTTAKTVLDQLAQQTQSEILSQMP